MPQLKIFGLFEVNLILLVTYHCAVRVLLLYLLLIRISSVTRLGFSWSE